MQLTKLTLAITAVLGGSFSPLSLFAAGEQGAWYDPSDLTTLFQDSAGTTPVTAVEQPVGLMLDRSKGLVLGSELASAAWTLNDAGASQNSGTFTFVNVTTPLAAQASIITAGRWYKVQFTIQSITSGGVSLTLEGGASTTPTYTTAGTYTAYLNATLTGNIFIYARTTPVNAVISGVSVKQLPGNHAFQATAGNRPTLSARVNLLTNSDTFQPTGGGPTFGTYAIDQIAPNGTLTASRVVTASSREFIEYSLASNGALTFSFFVKLMSGTSSMSVILKDRGTDTVRGTTNFTATTSWQQISVSGITAGALPGCRIEITGFAVGDVYWGADLRPTNIGANLPAYQRVNTSTDYDTTGFPLYLNCNGTSTAMATNSIDFSATDKMTVVAGVRKLSDAVAFGMVAELANRGTFQAGSFSLTAPETIATATYLLASNGSAGTASAIATGYAAPISNVLTGQSAISTPLANLRVNGAQAATSSATQGTGNYGNYPLYLFARAGTSLWFNGYFYGLIVRGATSTADQIAAAEQYIASKTGITF